jgi:chromosome segregation ATPase
MDSLGLLGSALGIISALVTGGVWLLKYNAKLQGQMLKAKRDLYEERFENLKKALGSLEYRLTAHAGELKENSTRLVKVTTQLEKTENKISSYVEATEKKIASFETVVVKISDDLIMLKNKKGSQ